MDQSMNRIKNRRFSMSINSTQHDETLEDVSKTKTLLRLFSYLLVYKKEIIVVTLMLLYSVVVSLVNPLLIEIAIDQYISRNDVKGLYLLCALAFALNIIMIFLIRIRMTIMAKVSNKVLVTIRQELYTHIQTLDFHFFDSRPTGKILARIIGDINSLKDVLSNSVTTLIPDLLIVISVITIMFLKNAALASAALITIPFMAASMWFIQVKSHKRWQIHKKKSSNLNAFVHEDLSGIRIIHSFAAEKETSETFRQYVEEHRSSFMDAVRINDAFGSVINISWYVGLISLYYFGIQWIGVEQVSVGTFIAFSTYVGMFWIPIMNISNFYNQLITNIAGAERIFEILDTKPELTDSDNVTQMPEIKGDVTFNDVSFSYDDSELVLDHISFHVQAGQSIALVGPTGAGKTTIINLISRFYDVQSGEIQIDGIHIRDVSIESLRSQMGIMTQDNFLFTGSIKENIRYGKLDATDEEIIAAAKAVNAHDFIMKTEDGYDTVLKERGNGLSIGQKQLLAFARTMVSKPKILILDEATSSIDTKTELLVQSGIESLLKGRTSFIIAHRLSTIQQADCIFVIEDGKITESGNAKELLAKKGAYYQLYMAQFQTAI